MRRTLHIYLLTLVTVVGAMCSTPAHAASKYTLITLLHTNDLHGGVIMAEGGLARAATLIRQIRAEMQHVIVVDTGDSFMCPLADYVTRGQATTAAMGAVGYTARAVGNHEFNLGLGVLHDVLAAWHCPALSANIQTTTGGCVDLIEPYTILDVDGVKLGILGLTDQHNIMAEWHGLLKDTIVLDPIETARGLVPQLRKKVDVVILLSHLGILLDTELAKKVPGIDFIIGGHSHTLVTDWTWVGNTYITQAGGHGEALGRVDFIVRKNERGSEVLSVNGRVRNWSSKGRVPLGMVYPDRPTIPISASIPVDYSVMKSYECWASKADAVLSRVIGYATETIPGRALLKTESPGGNMVADVFREFAGADIGIAIEHSVGALGLPAGKVTVESAYGIAGGASHQNAVVGRIKGADLVLAMSKEMAKKKRVCFAVSGASMVCGLQDGVPVLRELRVGKQPVEANKIYSVSAPAEAIQILQASAPVEIVKDSHEMTRDMVVDYIRTHKTISAPALGRVSIDDPGK